MIIDLPDSSTHIVIRRVYEAREAGGAVTLGRVLTLVVGVDDESDAEHAIEAANEASREHPCRIVVVVRHASTEPRAVLDAQIRVGADAGASEVIVLHLHGPLAEHSDSVVTPFLLPDTPIVTWWPGEGPAVPSADPLGRFARRRITGPSQVAPRTLIRRLRAGYASGDTHLAWASITSWRALLATAVEHPRFGPIDRAVVVGPAEEQGAEMLAGWLVSALDVPVQRASGEEHVALYSGDRVVALSRVSATAAVLQRPGERDQRVALTHRAEWECLAEELRRLDPDEIYESALEGVDRIHYVDEATAAGRE